MRQVGADIGLTRLGLEFIDFLRETIVIKTTAGQIFALSDNQLATITGLLDAIIEIVAIESQPIVGITEVYCENN